MAKYPTYKYEFEIDGEKFLLAIGESKNSNKGVMIKVHKFQRTELMNRLWITLDGGNWTDLEQGHRTPTGEYREYFKKYKMSYPQFAGNLGYKLKEIKYENRNTITAE